ncbi:hypothetical protein [Desulfovibrio piger]|uniref:InterPro IPR001173:IPR001687 COGs COG0463 n=1 Tax=Desulfovibrio piger TaxID=901 RepID=A0A1K1LDI2_9BACT|nr:hypothetical protein [Desulfovibrio piger]SFV72788.1 InterPro IPR001173:IPR001687 COGs COG0463 [Desulfovibrio piger]
MAVQETTQGADAKDARIKELTEENELLFEQLHVVQEELEKYYHKLKECEQRKGSGASDDGSVAVIPPQANEALAENLKLRALVMQQQAALQVESTNSLAARLGETLIHGVSSAGAFIALPLKLRQMWKALDQTVPPAALGGKSFQKVLDAHAAGGSEAVEKLLDSVFLSPVMRANAYTALARQVMLTDARQAADLARLAWETDPRPYRLKWLAFRLHEADDAINAEALLDMLPDDISMSDSEERQAARLRQEAKRERAQQAQKMMKASQSEAGQLQAAMAKLKQAAEESKKQQEALAAQLSKQREEHKQELARLNSQLPELKKAADQARQEAARAREAQAALQRQMEAQKKESDALAVQTAHMLQTLLTRFESDKPVLSQVVRVVMGASASK